jgi:hypothetical protein
VIFVVRTSGQLSIRKQKPTILSIVPTIRVPSRNGTRRRNVTIVTKLVTFRSRVLNPRRKPKDSSDKDKKDKLKKDAYKKKQETEMKSDSTVLHPLGAMAVVKPADPAQFIECKEENMDALHEMSVLPSRLGLSVDGRRLIRLRE